MSYIRLIFFVILCSVSCVWVVLALYAQYVRLEHRSEIAAITSNDMAHLPKAQQLSEAIADYNRALHFVPCSVPLHKDLSLLLIHNTDIAMATPYAPDADVYLEKTLYSLASLLSCTPMDGKAWLDFATIDTYREGFTEHAEGAYIMSEKMAPGEAWLAEKRLLFALNFKPLFTAEALAVARKDLATLERAHPNSMNAVLRASHVESKQALYGLFATQDN